MVSNHSYHLGILISSPLQNGKSLNNDVHNKIMKLFLNCKWKSEKHSSLMNTSISVQIKNTAARKMYNDSNLSHLNIQSSDLPIVLILKDTIPILIPSSVFTCKFKGGQWHQMWLDERKCSEPDQSPSQSGSLSTQLAWISWKNNLKLKFSSIWAVYNWARVAQWLEWRCKDMMILASPVRIPLWDVGAVHSDETVKTEVQCRSRCVT
jgi:hypothetical protein